jgi:hypothetical protein
MGVGVTASVRVTATAAAISSLCAGRRELGSEEEVLAL